MEPNRDVAGFRFEAQINPFDFALNSSRGKLEICRGVVREVSQRSSRWDWPYRRRNRIELEASECRPVTVNLNYFVRVRSSSRPAHLTFHPIDDSVTRCLLALAECGFELDQRAQALALDGN